MNSNEIKIELSKIGTGAKHNFGQNFLINNQVLKTIIKSAKIESSEVILEVGPGLGALTDELIAAGGKVTAIEADRDFFRYLTKKYQNHNLKLIFGDAISIIDSLEFKREFLNFDYKVVANIPYSITSKFLRLLLEAPKKPKLIVLLIQSEVAERIVAPVGKMSLLSLSVQYFGQPKIIEKVPRNSFWPAPKVDSAVIKIAEIKNRFDSETEKEFFRLARIGFSNRRKTLANNLSAGFRIARPEIIAIIKKSGFSENARAQEIGVEGWLKLFENIRRACVVK
jgi:16S rRNA (adenine1518-N6/adenine1519-N6)-dimethyltransferase